MRKAGRKPPPRAAAATRTFACVANVIPIYPTDAEKAALAKAEDKAVANYVANEKAKGKTVNVPSPAATPASGSSGADKGLPSQPEKASNAHSPPKK